MDLSIRYARTSDDVSIAWTTAGQGRSIVMLPVIPYGNVQLTPEVAPHVAQALTHAGTLYWYDARGIGMSDRSVVDFSTEAMMRDFAAVAAKVEPPITAFGITGGGRLALAAAAMFPEIIDRVIVGDIWGWAGQKQDTPAARMEQAIRGQDPSLYAQTVTQLLFSFAPAELAAGVAAYIAQSCAPEVLLKGVHANDEADIRPLLPQVTQPVLITQSRNNPWSTVSELQDLASRIPNCELVFVEDPFFFDSIPHWLRFLGSEAPRMQSAPDFRIILFTDIEGHSSIISRLGDAKGRELLREHERRTREALRSHGGDEVKSMGDGFMASFASTQAALECAAAIQRSFAEPVVGEDLRVRIGINAGEPVAEDDDLFGASVIAAARVAAMAEGGQVLVANVVRELVAGKGFLFHDTGQHDLKGLEEPVRLWELQWK